MSRIALIIGAGPAGLTAAWQLLNSTDIIPLIVEETAHIGGLARTVEYKGNRMDIGGHRFFSKNETVMELWRTWMPPQGAPAFDDLKLNRTVPLVAGGPNPEATDRVMLTRHRLSRIFYLRKFFDYPISLKPETFINMGLWRTLRAAAGYAASVLYKRPEKSLEDFMVNRFGVPLYKMFFEGYTEKLWGVHPRAIAPSWGAQRIKGLSLGKVLLNAITKPFKKLSSIAQKDTETSLIEQFYYPKLGPGQLWEHLAADITARGGKILLNTKLLSLTQEAGRITAATVETAGVRQTLTPEAVFSSMPIKDLVAGLNNVPAPVATVAQGLIYRDFMTVGLLVNKLALSNTTKFKTLGNIIPDCWIYIQEGDVKLGRLQIFNNWSPYLVKDPEHTVWLGLEYFCDEGDTHWQMSDADFIAFATRELVSIGLLASSDVLDGVRLKLPKAYPAYFGSYDQLGTVRDYLTAIPNLFCIGRNGQHRYNNQDHAMLTALKAVECLQNPSLDRAALWNVNAEQAYHETKA